MGVKFTYYGGMTVLVERSDGFKMLFDPYLTKNPQATAVPSDFYDVDVLFVTHNANDHYGDTEDIFSHSNCRLYCGAECVARARVNIDVPKARFISACYGDERKIDDITTVRPVFAVHHSKYEQPNDILSWAPPFGYIVMVEPGVVYYHAGDTAIFSDMKLYKDLYKPNVLTVGISRIRPGIPCEMPPREAALATSWIAPEVVIPTHYAPGSEDPEFFRDALRVMAPNVQIRGELGKTFTCTPFTVE